MFLRISGILKHLKQVGNASQSFRLLFQSSNTWNKPNNISENDKNDVKLENLVLPDVSLCCGRGCTNCVWLQYAETLLKHCSDKELNKKKIIDLIDKLDDENLKSFLLFELKDKLK